METNPTPTQQGETLDERCPWCAKPPDVHDKNNLGIRYLGCPTPGCTGRSIGFIIDHLWNRRAAVAGPGGDVFAAYNQAIEDAKAAIREEARFTDNAGSFINAIARRCSPHVYVNRLPAAASSPTPADDGLHEAGNVYEATKDFWDDSSDDPPENARVAGKREK